MSRRVGVRETKGIVFQSEKVSRGIISFKIRDAECALDLFTNRVVTLVRTMSDAGVSRAWLVWDCHM